MVLLLLILRNFLDLLLIGKEFVYITHPSICKYGIEL